MTAFYFSASTPDVLLGMVVGSSGGAPVILYQNVIYPQAARAATPSGTDPQGNPIPAVPAAGILGNYYMSINLPNVVGTPPIYAADGVTIITPAVPAVFPSTLPSGVIEDDVNGIAVLGVWA